jgi:hypothetical protein
MKQYKDGELRPYIIEGAGIVHKTGCQKLEAARQLIEKYKLTCTENNLRSQISRECAKKTPTSDTKPKGEFHWRTGFNYIKQGQQMFAKSKKSSDFAGYKIQTEKPVYVVCLGDLHKGSWGTNYETIEWLTDMLLEKEDLYCFLLGDLAQMSINLRGVKEVTDNALPPKYQMMMLESWLNEIVHKVVCSTWDNHSVMREEKEVGFSKYAEIFEERVNYFDHIGHLDLTVGVETYKIALAHFFNGRSYLNPVHGQARYMRMEGPDREICVAGDSHKFGYMHYTDGPIERLAVNSGTSQTNSGYAKRHFSLYTHDIFPVIKFWPDRHMFQCFKSLREAYDL